MADKPFYNHEDRDGAPDRCTCSTSSNPPCGYCTRDAGDDDDDPACYCLYCNWHGQESDLFDDIVRGFAVCPQCLGEDIVFTE